MRWTLVRMRDVQLRSQRRLEFVSLEKTFTSRIEVANREPGGGVAVAIERPCTTGLPRLRDWVVSVHL
jgi:hypothetical protein